MDSDGTLPLFPDDRHVPKALGFKDTSIEAYFSVIGVRNEQRSKVFRVIYESGAAGMTRDEIQISTGLEQNTINPRVWEIINAVPKVVQEGPDCRMTRSGRRGFVLRVIHFVNEER